MKKKIAAVLLVVALALGFGLVPTASVGANAGIGVGPMAIAPHGTIYAAVYDGTNWMVQKSNYGAHSWKETDLNDAGGPIAQIVVSPNYRKDKTVYVAVYDPPTVYRLEDAGDDATALKPVGNPGAGYAEWLFCVDVFTDEDDYNWILAGTEIDVFVLKDKAFEDWRDQDLEAEAYEVAFAPDFEDSELIWAVSENATSGAYMLTSTNSPGNWGQEVDEARIIDAGDEEVDASRFVDIDFPDNYDSDPDSGDTYVVLGVTSGDSTTADGDAGVYLIEGVEGDGDPTTWDSVCIELSDSDDPEDEDITSIAVSGDFGDDMVILAGDLDDPVVYISEDGDGEDWDEADKNPTGEGWTHVYMVPRDVAQIRRLAYASTFGNEGGVFRSHDFGFKWKLVSTKLFR